VGGTSYPGGAAHVCESLQQNTSSVQVCSAMFCSVISIEALLFGHYENTDRMVGINVHVGKYDSFG